MQVGDITQQGERVLKAAKAGAHQAALQMQIERLERVSLFTAENSFECQERLTREAVRAGAPLLAQPLLTVTAGASQRAREYVEARNAQIREYNENLDGQIWHLDPADLEHARMWAADWRAAKQSHSQPGAATPGAAEVAASPAEETVI